MHSPDLAALAPSEPVPLCAEPDCIDTDGPFGPIVVEPLSPPGPVLIVVEFDEEPLWEVDALPCAAPPCETRQGLLLSMTIVVPPLSPVTIETLAPPPLVVLVLSAKATGVRHKAAPAIREVARKARMEASFDLSPLVNAPEAGSRQIIPG